MRSIPFLSLIAITGLMSIGCAVQAPTLNFVPARVGLSKTKIQAELKSITISIAQENERTGATQVGFHGNQYEQSFKLSFKDALEEALTKSVMFNDLAGDKVSLLAKVLKFETPSLGVNFPTAMTVRYTLVDRATGNEIFNKDIDSDGSVAFDYAFAGHIRSAEARNIAVRNNITSLLESLAEFANMQASRASR